jgi:hypothetical protein
MKTRKKKRRTPSWSPFEKFEPIGANVDPQDYAAEAGVEDREGRLKKTFWFLVCSDDSVDEIVPVSAVLPGAENREFRGMGYSKGD